MGDTSTSKDEGDSCMPQMGCGAGKYCMQLNPNIAIGICRAYSQAGEFCLSMASGSPTCGHGLRCASGGGSTGFCEVAPRACAVDTDCYGGGYCQSGACAAWRTRRQSCSSDLLCAPGLLCEEETNMFFSTASCQPDPSAVVVAEEEDEDASSLNRLPT